MKSRVSETPVLLMPWRDFAAANSLGINFTKAAMSSGELRTKLVGGRRMIALKDAEAFVSALPDAPKAINKPNLRKAGTQH